jgi:hypothetical protein
VCFQFGFVLRRIELCVVDEDDFAVVFCFGFKL